MLVISFRRGFFFFFDAPSSSSTGLQKRGTIPSTRKAHLKPLSLSGST